MLSQPLPDLASTLALQSQTRTLRAALDAAGQELTTGQSANITAATRGDLAPVFAIDRQLERLEMNQRDLALAEARASTAQDAMGVVEKVTSELGIGLLSAIDLGDVVVGSVFLTEATPMLETVMNALNVDFGGRSLFAGAAEDQRALAGTEALLTAVSGLVAAAATPADALAALDAYCAPGGGFETDIYGGSPNNAAGAYLTDGSRVDFLPRADDAALRSALKNIAIVATVDSAGFAGDLQAREDYLSQTAGALIGARDQVIQQRAALGTSQQLISDAREAVVAEKSALGISRNNLVGVDQYDAAARFADLEGQLEALYVVTSRISTLSLTNFLR